MKWGFGSFVILPQKLATISMSLEQSENKDQMGYLHSLVICRPSGCTVVSGIIVDGVCDRSQMRTSKCTCLIFGVSIDLDHG